MTMQRYLAGGGAILALAVLCGTAQPSAPQKATPTRAKSGPALVRTEIAYPTGDKATAVILMERITPAEVRAKTDFEYQIKLTNLTKLELRDLRLIEQFPLDFQVLATAPQTELDTQGHGVWKWPRFAPGASRAVRVRGSFDRTETLSLCGTVTFSAVSCASINVVEPELTLTKSAPREVLICDPIPLTFVVSNPGTGMVRNVRVVDVLPAGLATTDGKNGFTYEVGDLAAGQSRQFSVNVRAEMTGEFLNRATAEDDSGLTAEASATTTVRQPVLVVTKRGPKQRYLGREAVFEITVQNIGDAPARDAVLTDPVPPGCEFVSAEGGRLVDGVVRWNLGTLPPRSSETVRLSLKPREIGVTRNTATVEAYCATAAADARLEIRGIPAILLELVDDPDPIEVGGNVTYSIAVTNQGSAVGTNIVIECTLPAELEYVSATGPTPEKTDGRTVRFAPLASLAPKAKSTFTVVARGTQEADVRFKVSMQSDQTTSAVEETESTHVY